MKRYDEHCNHRWANADVLNFMQPKIIIHGGAGSSLQGKGGLLAVRESLHHIVAQVHAELLQGISAAEAVVLGGTTYGR